MTFSVADALDRRVDALEVPRQPDGLWHPSALFGCDRKAIYTITGTPESNPADARSKRVFRVGHVIHELIQEAVREDLKSGIIKAAYEELPIAIPRLKVGGSADQLVQLANDRWKLLEYKSIGVFALRKNDLPKEDHVKQASVYMLGLREVGSVDPTTGMQIVPPLGDKLDVAVVAYVGKDDMEVQEKHVHWTDAKQAEIEQTVARLEEARASGTLPPRLPETVVKGKAKRDWRCNYCPFMTKCWDEDPA